MRSLMTDYLDEIQAVRVLSNGMIDQCSLDAPDDFSCPFLVSKLRHMARKPSHGYACIHCRWKGSSHGTIGVFKWHTHKFALVVFS